MDFWPNLLYAIIVYSGKIPLMELIVLHVTFDWCCIVHDEYCIKHHIDALSAAR